MCVVKNCTICGESMDDGNGTVVIAICITHEKDSFVGKRIKEVFGIDGPIAICHICALKAAGLVPVPVRQNDSDGDDMDTMDRITG